MQHLMKRRPRRRSRTQVKLLRAFRTIALSMMASTPLVAIQACSRCSGSPSVEGTSEAGPSGSSSSALTEEVPVPPELRGECAPIELDASAFDDSGTGCTRYLRAPCGLPKDGGLRGCFPDLNTCLSVCQSAFRCQLAPETTCQKGHIIPDASIVVECIQCAQGGGRKPYKLTTAPFGAGEARGVGDFFAELSYLEEASITAFDELAEELARAHAPSSLRRRAMQAKRDEEMHTRAMQRLARIYGGAERIRPPSFSEAPRDESLEALMIHNAREGCVGESYGALLALHQSANASDPRVARVMAKIAEDEAEHAALSWDILSWGQHLLTLQEQERVLHVMRESLEDLARLVSEPTTALRVTAGYPSASQHHELVERLCAVVERMSREVTREAA